MPGMQGRRRWQMPLAGVGAVSVYLGASFRGVAVQTHLSASVYARLRLCLLEVLCLQRCGGCFRL